MVVGAALAGRDPGEALAEPSVALVSEPLASAAPPASGSGWTAASPLRITVDWPQAGSDPIHTRDVVVSGRVHEDTRVVELRLKSVEDQAFAVLQVSPSTLPWDRDPNVRPSFVGVVPLPRWRPSGQIYLQVVAYDATGRPLDIVLRPLRIGAVIDPPVADSLVGRPETGEDGLMGGIPFGTNLGVPGT